MGRFIYLTHSVPHESFNECILSNLLTGFHMLAVQLNTSLNENMADRNLLSRTLCIRLISSIYQVLNMMLNLHLYTDSGRYVLYLNFFLTVIFYLKIKKQEGDLTVSINWHLLYILGREIRNFQKILRNCIPEICSISHIHGKWLHPPLPFSLNFYFTWKKSNMHIWNKIKVGDISQTVMFSKWSTLLLKKLWVCANFQM